MRHPRRWIFIAVVLVVVLAAGGALAYYVFGGSTPAKPKLSNSASTATGAQVPSTPDGTWRVETAKTVYVGYRIKELFGGATLKRDAVGRTGHVSGTLKIANDQVQSTTVTANVATLESDRAPRDNYIHTHSLDSDQFPKATFALTTPITFPAGTKVGQALHLQGTGTLTLHGVTKPVTLTLDARWNGATIEVAGTAPIVLADFGIDPPHTPIVSVDDHGSLELHLLFTH